MKIAIPIWEGRVSPVLDVARRILLAEVHNGQCTGESEQLLVSQEPVNRAEELARLGVAVVLCAGLSDDLSRHLCGHGICVAQHWCGPAEDVLKAFFTNEPENSELIMPGCHCPAHRRPARQGAEPRRQP